LPERRFGDLTDSGRAAAATSSNPATPRMVGPYGDTLPSAQSQPQGVNAATPPQPAQHAAGPAGPAAPMARKDTVALIDEASRGRELSPAVSIMIIAVLMLVAGIATYAWRVSQTPDRDTPAASDDASSDESKEDSDPKGSE
jgi:hypothetical protein